MSYHIMDFCISMLYFTSESEYHSVHRWSNHWIPSGRGKKKNDLRSGWVRSNPINLASQSISNVHDVHQMSIKCPSISRTVHTSTHQLPLKTSPRAILSRDGLEKNASLEVKFAKESVRIAAEEMKVCSETLQCSIETLVDMAVGWTYIIYIAYPLDECGLYMA